MTKRSLRMGLGGCGLLLALGCARGPNVAAESLPLDRVVIYRNGVAYYERAGEVDSEQVTFEMREEMVGDFLASLAVVEEGGSSVRAAAFPLEEEDESATPAEPEPCLGPMPCPPPPPPQKKGKGMREVVLSLDGKKHQLAVGYLAETPVWRPSYRVVVSEKGGEAQLQGWGIIQNRSGEDWNNVQLSLVAGAPISFRSTLGDAVIPERPTITDEGEVTQVVPTSSTTLQNYGEEAAAAPPVPAMAQPQEESAEMADMAAEKEGGGGPRAKASMRLENKRYAATGLGRGAPMAAPSPTASGAGYGAPGGMAEARPVAPSAPAIDRSASVEATGATTRYDLPYRVSVPDGSASMVLVVNAQVPGEAVYLFDPRSGASDSGVHPYRVLRFQNGTQGLLERGPIAVFQRGAFLGQGHMDPLPAGAKTTIPFALERGISVTSEQKSDELGSHLARVDGGMIWVDQEQQLRTTYRVRNGSADAVRVLVKHYRSTQGRLVGAPEGTEKLDDGALVPVPVSAHKTGVLPLDERYSHRMQVGWDSYQADVAVKTFLKDGRGDAGLRAQLEALWKRRDQVIEARNELAKVSGVESELDRTASELRNNLEVLRKNPQAADLRAKLTARLDAITTQQATVSKQRVELAMKVAELEIRFGEELKELKVPNQPTPEERVGAGE